MSIADCESVPEGFDVMRRRLAAIEAVTQDTNSEWIMWNHVDAWGAVHEMIEALREAIDATEASWRAEREEDKPARVHEPITGEAEKRKYEELKAIVQDLAVRRPRMMRPLLEYARAIEAEADDRKSAAGD